MGRKSNDNRVIEIPVRMIADVKALLSEAINTLSGLCSSSKINIFAKYKPVKWSGTTRSNTWWKSVDQNCGIKLEPYNDLVEMTNDWYNVQGFDWRHFWKHVPPTGGTYPYRLLDFNNYRHTGSDPNADKPFTGYRLEPQVIRYLMDDEESLVGVSPTIYKRTANDTYLLQLSDISVRKGQGYLNLNNTYFGIAIMQEGQVRKYAFITGYYKFNENVTGTDRMDNSSGYNIRSIPTIGHDTLPANGDYYVFPFLSESRLWSDTNGEPWKMKERESFATGGLFIPLPYYGQMITVVKQTPDIKIELQAYQTRDDKIRLNIIATNVASSAKELNWSFLTYHYTETQKTPQGEYDYQNAYELEGQWGTGTTNISAGATTTVYRDFNLRHRTIEFNLYGGYISDIRVESSYGYIETPVSAPNFDWITDDSEVEFSSYEQDMEVGETSTWSVTTTPSSGMTLQWSSDNTSVATVSGNGKNATVTAIGVGTAWIRCEATNYYAWAETWVDVHENSGGGSTTIHVTSVGLVPSEKTIKVNEKASFAVNFTPANCSNKNVRWWSDNPSIASVNASTGQVTGKSVGWTWINVETVDGRKTASAKIIVNPNNTGTAVTSVAIDYDVIDILTGSANAITLTATVYPTSATNKNVTWSYSSGGGTYVTLSASGLKCTVTGKAVTSTPVTITVKTQDGNYTATCKVNVYSSGGGGTKINVAGISLDKTSATAYVNRSIPITATISPPNATYKTVVWQSSDANVATVDQQGNVRGVAVGQCQIAARATNGTSSTSDDKTATCYITVEQLVTKITLNKYTLSLTLEGQHSSETIQTTISPSNATNKALNWRSTYPEIAEVQSNGLVIARGIGVCNIWVEAADGGGAFNIVDVEVTEDGSPDPHIRLESVDIKDSQGIVRNGQTIVMNRTSYRTEQLSYAVTPNNATDLSIGWSSRSEGVATVSLNGLVTVVAAGETIIDLNINGYDSSFASNWVKIKVN